MDPGASITTPARPAARCRSAAMAEHGHWTDERGAPASLSSPSKHATIKPILLDP
jgi:hypothetical protein